MEFVCNVLVVADQLLITRLKEICEVVITENRKSCDCRQYTLSIFTMFLEEASFAHQGCIYLIRYSNIVKYYYNLKELFSV